MPDLFDFFKENESKLYERPSEQAWNRLEEQLEVRRRRRRRIRFLQTWLVVVTLLLLLLAAGLVWYFASQANP